MKLAKLSLVAAMVLGGLIACSNIASAQDNGTNAAPGTKKGKGRFSVEQQMERLDTELKLTDEQKPKVKAVLEERNKKMAELRGLPQDERRDKMQAIMAADKKKMKEILTDDQYTKYEKWLEQQRGGKKKKSDSSTQ